MSFWAAIIFWLVGIVVMFGGKIADNLLRYLEKKFHKKAKENAQQDHSAHMVYGAVRNIVDVIPWFAVNPVFIIFGMVIIALGFVPFSFYLSGYLFNG
jgi:uncharacterized membrane protein